MNLLRGIILRNECIFFVVLLACKSVDRSTICMKRALHTKNVPRFTLLHAYNTTKKMHSILKITFKSHQNLI
jgi:hypothetical protein